MTVITLEIARRQIERHSWMAWAFAMKGDVPAARRELGYVSQWHAVAIGLASR